MFRDFNVDRLVLIQRRTDAVPLCSFLKIRCRIVANQLIPGRNVQVPRLQDLGTGDIGPAVDLRSVLRISVCNAIVAGDEGYFLRTEFQIQMVEDPSLLTKPVMGGIATAASIRTSGACLVRSTVRNIMPSEKCGTSAAPRLSQCFLRLLNIVLDVIPVVLGIVLSLHLNHAVDIHLAQCGVQGRPVII